MYQREKNDLPPEKINWSQKEKAIAFFIICMVIFTLWLGYMGLKKEDGPKPENKPDNMEGRGWRKPTASDTLAHEVFTQPGD